MKREFRSAISQAIKDSELNGYKWTITKNGLKWSYMDEEFTFDTPEENILTVKNRYSTFATIWYEDCKYADCKTLTEAYYLATKATIREANYAY